MFRSGEEVQRPCFVNIDDIGTSGVCTMASSASESVGTITEGVCVVVGCGDDGCKVLLWESNQSMSSASAIKG